MNDGTTHDCFRAGHLPAPPGSGALWAATRTRRILRPFDRYTFPEHWPPLPMISTHALHSYRWLASFGPRRRRARCRTRRRCAPRRQFGGPRNGAGAAKVARVARTLPQSALRTSPIVVRLLAPGCKLPGVPITACCHSQPGAPLQLWSVCLHHRLHHPRCPNHRRRLVWVGEVRLEFNRLGIQLSSTICC